MGEVEKGGGEVYKRRCRKRCHRRPGGSPISLVGLFFAILGIIILLITIPIQFWIFIFGLGCLLVGIFLMKI